MIQQPVIQSNVLKTEDKETVSQLNVQPIVSQSTVQPIVSQSNVQQTVSSSVSFPRVHQQTMSVSSDTMMTTPMSELFPIIKQAEAVKPKRRSKFGHS